MTQTSRTLLAALAGLAGSLAFAADAGAATQTFAADGTFTVPAGVSSISVDVEGAQGGDGPGGAEGGLGGLSRATLAVTPGTLLTVLVGGRGAAGRSGTAPGGANGGGVGGNGAGGGGGRSEIDAGATRLVVAGGGGGASAIAGGGSGGNHGGAGGGVNGVVGGGTLDSLQGGGGLPGTQSAGGAGGPHSEGCGPPDCDAGSDGASGQGGNGGTSNIGGGGGGGGYFGGGGGGGGTAAGGGGGGGSGHLSAGVTNPAMGTSVRSGDGVVTITYAPSEAFAFPRVTVGASALTFTFRFPGRGTLDARITTHNRSVGHLHVVSDGAGPKRLRVSLNRRGRRILATRGKLPVRLTLVYTPRGGRSSRQARKYTIRGRS